MLPPLHACLRLCVQHDHMTIFPQGIWGGHFPDISAEYVHPVSGKGALWLCNVCPHPARLGGGRGPHYHWPLRWALHSLLQHYPVFHHFLWSIILSSSCIWYIMSNDSAVSHVVKRDTDIWPVMLFFVFLIGCHLPSLPWDVVQMGTPFRTEQTGHHLILWWVMLLWSVTFQKETWSTVEMSMYTF